MRVSNVRRILRALRILLAGVVVATAVMAGIQFCPSQAAAGGDHVIDTVVGRLDEVYRWLEKDPDGKQAVADAKGRAESLTGDPSNSPWAAIFVQGVLPITLQVKDRLGNGNEGLAKERIVGLLCDAASLRYTSDSVALKEELEKFKTDHEGTVTALFGDDFTVDDLYGFLLEVERQAPNAVTEGIEVLAAIAGGDYGKIKESVKKWTKAALRLAVDQGYQKFETKLGEVGWSVDGLAEAWDVLGREVDPEASAEIAAAKAFVRSETSFVKDAPIPDPIAPGDPEPGQPVNLYVGDVLPCKLSVMGYNWAGKVLSWKTEDVSVAKVEGKSIDGDPLLKAVGVGSTRVFAYRPGGNPDTDWLPGIYVKVAERPAGPGEPGPGGPSVPPADQAANERVQEAVRQVLERLGLGAIDPQQAAQEIAGAVANLVGRQVAAETREMVRNAAVSVARGAGTVPASGMELRPSDRAVEVRVLPSAVSARMGEVLGVIGVLGRSLDEAGLGDVMALVPRVVTVEVPPAAARKLVDVRVPMEAVDALNRGGFALSVRTPDATLDMSPEAVTGPGEGGGQRELGVRVEQLESSVATGLLGRLPRLPSGSIRPVGSTSMLEISVGVVDPASGTLSPPDGFGKPIRGQLRYDTQAAVDPASLAAFRFDKKRERWEGLSSYPDPASGAVRFRSSLLSPVTVLAFVKTFQDLEGHWAKEYVETMASRQVVKGMTDTNFAPDLGVTRAQFAALLVRATGLREDSAGTTGTVGTTGTAGTTGTVGTAGAAFSDVPKDAWYAGAVAAAVKAGLMKGYGPSTFGPEDSMTREQMAVVLARALRAEKPGLALKQGEREVLLKPYADRTQISAWAEEDTAFMVKQGIIKGRAADMLAPREKVTRAESVTALYRFWPSLFQ